ncbi:MAG: oligopeptide ABC transporter ATP-binding protein OppF [SAR86 cluster bacterium]|uniref:Oligopeptide ABC transporter ATP-binding protein OppF n=1 Tax=SAR86 cluster bacterium TaxID=2030880 RepID=A0A2A4MM24_9GAMM|nr:MAG: oligopeptide ABC transporter ATP-binding protein OppF [SAR86 cluster bacterium]
MPEPKANLLEAIDLSRTFKIGKSKTVYAVNKVSLAIAEQEILGLVGESGSGKSTFGKTLVGLHDKTSGSVKFQGKTLPQQYGTADFQAMATQMQMIFQDPYSSLNPRMTVGEIIGEGLRLHTHKSRSEINEAVSAWLQRVGLHPEHGSRYPHEFSGGQRQRIGIARALIVEPKFVVCDEPISALDVSVQAQVVNLLAELKHSMGLTLLFIAHDLSMVRYVSDRMAVMYLGSIVEIGNADELYFNPQHPYTKVLIASNPEPDPRSERQRTSTDIQGEIPSPLNLPTGCSFVNRCPQAMEVCKESVPELIPLKDLRRKVACHLY